MSQFCEMVRSQRQVSKPYLQNFYFKGQTINVTKNTSIFMKCTQYIFKKKRKNFLHLVFVLHTLFFFSFMWAISLDDNLLDYYHITP